MLKSCFFNSVLDPQGVPDRPFNADDFARYFGTLIKNGVFPNPSTNFQCIADQETMAVKMEAGICWIDGHLGYDDNVHILEIDTADSVLDRIDRIVLRKDVLDRDIHWVVKKGEMSGKPVAPTLQRDENAWELGIADVKVAHGTVSISQSMVTDTRLNTELCGLVTGVVTQIDTTTLFNQLEQWKSEYIANTNNWTDEQKALFLAWVKQFEIDSSTWKTEQEKLFVNWSSAEKRKFDEWFLTIKNILDTNAAGNLQSQIDKLVEKDKKLETEDVRLENSKLNVPQYVEYTMLANRWSGNSYSFEQEYPFSKYTVTVLGAIDKTTSEQIEAFGNASIVSVLTNQTVIAKDLIPNIDIIVGLEVVKKNGIS